VLDYTQLTGRAALRRTFEGKTNFFFWFLALIIHIVSTHARWGKKENVRRRRGRLTTITFLGRAAFIDDGLGSEGLLHGNSMGLLYPVYAHTHYHHRRHRHQSHRSGGGTDGRRNEKIISPETFPAATHVVRNNCGPFVVGPGRSGTTYIPTGAAYHVVGFYENKAKIKIKRVIKKF